MRYLGAPTSDAPADGDRKGRTGDLIVVLLASATIIGATVILKAIGHELATRKRS